MCTDHTWERQMGGSYRVRWEFKHSSCRPAHVQMPRHASPPSLRLAESRWLTWPWTPEVDLQLEASSCRLALIGRLVLTWSSNEDLRPSQHHNLCFLDLHTGRVLYLSIAIFWSRSDRIQHLNYHTTGMSGMQSKERTRHSGGIILRAFTSQ